MKMAQLQVYDGLTTEFSFKKSGGGGGGGVDKRGHMVY